MAATMNFQSWQIWRDRRGRLSPLRVGTLALLLFPVAKALVDYADISGGARPLNDLIHRAGFWALVFLGLSLAVTPFRRVARYGNLIDVRRMIGVATFIYAFAHVALYVADQRYDVAKIFSELTTRLYLIIGGIAWLGLAVLTLTSTDGWVRRLGGMNWRRLHQVIYVIALLALVHYFQQTKANVTVPVFAAGLLTWLMGYRLLAWRQGGGELSTLKLLVLAVVVSLLTFAGEAIGIGLTFNVSPLRVLDSVFDFDVEIRPGWQVLAAGLVVAAVDAVRARFNSRPARVRTAPAA
ncbi:MAG: protein-methionine-sulfoxide reductase heme-binding subunit MsrQ [Pseudolabrys sp.]|nr:protein-methionine-sulfoxide reductase heme-binding subunit MsrQ [Pseudolabrys sp.]